jgi:hypothetical protein
MTQPGYIFIVGSFRTGTTLLRDILNCSEDVAICGETHFFRSLSWQGFRRKFAKVGDISTDDGAKKVADYIYHNIHGDNFWRWVQKEVDYKDFLRGLLGSERSDRAIFDLVMAFYADGKPVRGEKTPAHIHHVPTLLEWFPKAKIIHTFRDPRAIFVSKKRKKKEQENASLRYRIVRQSELIFDIYLSFNVLIHWLRIAQLHYRYQRLYPHNYYFVKYEDLISDPKTHLEKLCDFLEIDLTEMMLRPKVVNSSFVSDDQIQGFDSSAIDRWRKQLHPMINYWFVLWCKKRLLEFGYRL